MTRREFLDVVRDMSEAEQRKILRILMISLSRREARPIIADCSGRGLSLDDTLAELSRHLTS
jgi:hypothetical protein